MVRPVEFSGLISKTQQAVRMQQSAEMRPEAAHEFSKALSEKLKLQKTHAPTPTPETDQVMIHVGEKEKEKRETAEDHMDDEHEHESEGDENQQSGDITAKEQSAEEYKKTNPDGNETAGHIDIKI